MMLSLPDDWNYTTRGLAKSAKEGVDAIGGALRELESAVTLFGISYETGKAESATRSMSSMSSLSPDSRKRPSRIRLHQILDSPDTAFPYLDKTGYGKARRINIEKSNTQKSITQRARTDSIPFREPAAARPPERKGRDAISLAEMESYRDLILENIEYDHLCRSFRLIGRTSTRLWS